MSSNNRIYCLLLLVICQAGYSQDKTTVQKDSSRHLAPVTVTSYILPPHLAMVPVQVLKGNALDRLNSLSVADAMRFFSGVQLKDYGGIGGIKTLDVRSMGTNHLGVFYNGIPLGNAQNGIVDLGKFSLDNLDELALYNAQRDAIFQPARSYASGSALYLQTHTPVFRNGRNYNLRFSLKTGSFGLFNPSVLWQQKINDRLAASLNAELTRASGKYRFRYTNGVYDTTATRENAGITAYRVESALYGLLRDSSRWNLNTYYYSSERGLPGAVVANKFQHSQRQWDDNFFVQGSYHKQAGTYSLMVNAKYARDYTRYVDPEYNNLQGYLDNRYTQQEWYLSAANRFTIAPWWELSLALDGQYNTLDANLYHFVYPRRYTFLGALATALHFRRVEAQASLLATKVNEKVKDYAAAADASEYTPSIAFSWQPFASPDLKLRGFYKNIFRIPTFNDLYYTFIGNTNLHPEYVSQYDMGLSWAKPSTGLLQLFFVQADAYYNRVRNKIVAIPTTNLFRWMMINLGEVQVKGLDVSLQSVWKVSEVKINTGFKYTYQRSLDITKGAFNYRQQIPYMPVHSGSAITDLEYKSWSLQYSFIYTGERYSQKANIPANYVQPWYTHDLSLIKQLPWKSRDIKLTAAINNVLNQYYDVVLNYPMPGRNYRLGIQVNL